MKFVAVPKANMAEEISAKNVPQLGRQGPRCSESSQSSLPYDVRRELLKFDSIPRTLPNRARGSIQSTASTTLSIPSSKKDIEKSVAEDFENRVKKRLESMTDEEIIEMNLKLLQEKSSREERKANGRLVALVAAFFFISLAMYQAWTTKTRKLAGALIPALIMVSYGGWVVMLAKRDKRKRLLFEKNLVEVTLKNKTELKTKARLKHKTRSERSTLKFENEKEALRKSQNGDTVSNTSTPTSGKSSSTAGEHRKHRRIRHHQNRINGGESESWSSGSGSGSGSCDSRRNSEVRVAAGGRTKRPSIRQKLFKQNAVATQLLIPLATGHMDEPTTSLVPVHKTRIKKKRLQRLDALLMPKMMRTSSAP